MTISPTSVNSITSTEEQKKNNIVIYVLLCFKINSFYNEELIINLFKIIFHLSFATCFIQISSLIVIGALLQNTSKIIVGAINSAIYLLVLWLAKKSVQKPEKCFCCCNCTYLPLYVVLLHIAVSLANVELILLIWSISIQGVSFAIFELFVVFLIIVLNIAQIRLTTSYCNAIRDSKRENHGNIEMVDLDQGSPRGNQEVISV